MALPILEVPVYQTTIPSTKQTINFRPFLVKEHKVLMTLAESTEDEIAKTIRELIGACTNNLINIDELSNFDVEYLFLQLRSKSIGDEVGVIVNCDCGEKINHVIKLSDAKVVFDEKHTNKIFITPTVGIEMRYPRFEEVVGVYESGDQQKVLDLIVSCVKGLFTETEYYDAKTQTRQEIEEFLNNLTKLQFDKLEEFFTTMPRLVQHIEKECPKCNTLNKVDLKGLQNFFV